MRFLFLILTLLLVRLTAVAADPAPESRTGGSAWETSVVSIDVRRKQYDYILPWTTPMQNLQKYGVILEGKQILTTAESLDDRTLLRIQKDGRGKWYVGDVTWIDYHANVALVHVDDESFWKGLKPVKLASPVTTADPFLIVRWRNGKLESRRAEFNQFNVEDSKLSWVQYLQMEVNSEINGAGWSEPIFSAGKLMGLVSSQNGNSCRVIPSSFIKNVLDAQKAGKFRGLGYFDFTWQISENPTTFKYLKFDGAESRGVVVIEVPRTATNSIHPRDIILQVEGYDIDNSGDYLDPDYGHVLLENLATRNKWAGDTVRIKVWREGKTLDIKYTIPKADFAARLIPEGLFNERPQYVVLGGLVFQPLDNDFLRSWGADFRRRAPFRLSYYNNQPPTKDRPSLVLLSQVLPDAFNLGYQEYRYLVVDTVNDKKITNLQELREALKKPVDDYHVIKFEKGDSLRKIILDAGEEEKASQRVLTRYGIEKDHYLIEPKKNVATQ